MAEIKLHSMVIVKILEKILKFVKSQEDLSIKYQGALAFHMGSYLIEVRSAGKVIYVRLGDDFIWVHSSQPECELPMAEINKLLRQKYNEQEKKRKEYFLKGLDL